MFDYAQCAERAEELDGCKREGFDRGLELHQIIRQKTNTSTPIDCKLTKTIRRAVKEWLRKVDMDDSADAIYAIGFCDGTRVLDGHPRVLPSKVEEKIE